jgi:CheY-like chemotaxis protein
MPTASRGAPAILVVNDEPIVARLLPRFLQSVVAGAPVLAASDGIQALEILAARPVRLVITNYHLPGMTGPELARAIRAGWPAIRIILISDRATAELAKHAQAHQFDGYVIKPFTREQLAQIVQTVLA